MSNGNLCCVSDFAPRFSRERKPQSATAIKPGGLPSRHRIGRHTSLVALAALANRETASHRCGSRQSNWPVSKFPRPKITSHA